MVVNDKLEKFQLFNRAMCSQGFSALLLEITSLV